MTGMRSHTDHESRLDWWRSQIERQPKSNLTVAISSRLGTGFRFTPVSKDWGDLNSMSSVTSCRAGVSLCTPGHDVGPDHARRMVDLLIDGLRYGAVTP
jgi:hypothetical protein